MKCTKRRLGRAGTTIESQLPPRPVGRRLGCGGGGRHRLVEPAGARGGRRGHEAAGQTVHGGRGDGAHHHVGAHHAVGGRAGTGVQGRVAVGHVRSFFSAHKQCTHE